MSKPPVGARLGRRLDDAARAATVGSKPEPIPEGRSTGDESAEPQPVVYVQGRRTNGLAVASLVLGILWLFWIGSLLAVIFGHIAVTQIDQDTHQSGRGLAIAGLTLGWVGLAFILIPLMIGSMFPGS